MQEPKKLVVVHDNLRTKKRDYFVEGELSVSVNCENLTLCGLAPWGRFVDKARFWTSKSAEDFRGDLFSAILDNLLNIEQPLLECPFCKLRVSPSLAEAARFPYPCPRCGKITLNEFVPIKQTIMAN